MTAAGGLGASPEERRRRKEQHREYLERIEMEDTAVLAAIDNAGDEGLPIFELGAASGLPRYPARRAMNRLMDGGKVSLVGITHAARLRRSDREESSAEVRR